jgi:hypothetical protein
MKNILRPSQLSTLHFAELKSDCCSPGENLSIRHASDELEESCGRIQYFQHVGSTR